MKETAFVEVTPHMGGVEFSTLYLAQRLDRSRWCPFVICPEDGDLPQRCRESNIEVEIVPRSRFFSTSTSIAERRIVNPIAFGLNAAAVIGSARSLTEFLDRRRPALVVTKGLLSHFYGGLAARLAGVPCIWHVQDRVSERAGPLFQWMLAVAGRILADEIIVDAASIKKQFRPFVAPERISVIWNGVDTDEFTPRRDASSVRKGWNADKDDLLIGVVGRLTPWKGQRILVRAFAAIARQFPRSRLIIIGSPLFESDGYEQQLKADVTRLGLNGRVTFEGFRWDLPEVLNALDLVVHTALEKDSSPLAVVSAMAAGRPIVCTRVDGIAEMFEEGVDGLLVPPGDVQALANEISRLLKDGDMRSSLGQAARRKAERELNLDKFASQCEQVFTRALK